MISVQEAEQLIARSLSALPSEACPVSQAHGRILREDLRADRDLPPFDRVMMDGIAFAWSPTEKGKRRYAIEGTALPGEPARSLRDRAHGCLQVMTGAVLPEGCDCVAPYEELTISGREAILAEGVRPALMQYVHRRGSDRKQGDLLLAKGCRLHSAQIAVAASTGRTHLEVACRPSIAVVSNGNELVDIGRPVEPFQIRPINNYSLQGALLRRGLPAVATFHTRDDRAEMADCLRAVLGGHDLVILTGGVSMGRHDYVPGVLKDLGVEVVFHRVRQRPGKPFWFGLSRDKKPVFALPGNPVSALVCCHRYVLPQVERAMGARPEEPEYAELTEDITFDLPLALFAPVSLACTSGGRLTATPVPFNNSGDFASLAESDGFVELEAERHAFAAGTAARLWRW